MQTFHSIFLLKPLVTIYFLGYFSHIERCEDLRQRRVTISGDVFVDVGVVDLKLRNRELKQPRRRRQQKLQKFAYLTMKNSIFARFARAFFSS